MNHKRIHFILGLTIAIRVGLIAVFGKSLYKNEERFLLPITGLSGMLLLNVFFPHLIAALALWMYLPGVITAVVINLPLTTHILWHIYKDARVSPKHWFLLLLREVSLESCSPFYSYRQQNLFFDKSLRQHSR